MDNWRPDLLFKILRKTIDADTIFLGRCGSFVPAFLFPQKTPQPVFFLFYDISMLHLRVSLCIIHINAQVSGLYIHFL